MRPQLIKTIDQFGKNCFAVAQELEDETITTSQLYVKLDRIVKNISDLKDVIGNNILLKKKEEGEDE